MEPFNPITIYQADSANQSFPIISSSPAKPSQGILLGFLRGIGLGFLVLAFATLILTLAPILIQEINFRTTHESLPPAQPGFGTLLDTISAQKVHQAAEDAARYGVPTAFSIVIPKISAKSPIIPNVDPADESAYMEALKTGVAHAAGTKFPGQTGTIYLFAHSTNSTFNVARYNAVFYLLKELKAGDDIIIFFAGQEYKYQVTDNQITDANDTTWLVDVPGEERLVLQTCWPPGTTFKRLLIIAAPSNP